MSHTHAPLLDALYSCCCVFSNNADYLMRTIQIHSIIPPIVAIDHNSLEAAHDASVQMLNASVPTTKVSAFKPTWLPFEWLFVVVDSDLDP